MYCAIPKTACQMQSWKRPVDCTTSEARTVSEASKPNENLIPEKVYSAAAEPQAGPRHRVRAAVRDVRQPPGAQGGGGRGPDCRGAGSATARDSVPDRGEPGRGRRPGPARAGPLGVGEPAPDGQHARP